MAYRARCAAAPPSNQATPQFEILGESDIPLISHSIVTRPCVPVVVVGCLQCGLITQHAQGSLGLIEHR